MSDASKIDDGGQAFPHIARTGFYTSQQVGPAQYASVPELAPVPGLTKRDYFAAAALIGLGTWTPNTDISLGDEPSRHDMDSVVVRRARWALAQADALIAASKSEAHHG